jgi:hypothetical protein
MNPKNQCIITLALTAVILLMFRQFMDKIESMAASAGGVASRVEKFVTKRDKAAAIYEWFRTNTSPVYSKYKKDLQGSNIVEYEDVLTLFKNRDLTVESVEKMI